VGLLEGVTQGKAVGMAEDLAAGVQQSQADTSQQTQEAELQRGIKYIGPDEWQTESRRRREEESRTEFQNVIEKHRTTAEVIKEKTTVRLSPPPAVVEKGNAAASTKKEYATTSIQIDEIASTIDGKSVMPALRKENSKPKGMGIDPFQSLIGLALKK
jgi:hypothetical protein